MTDSPENHSNNIDEAKCHSVGILLRPKSLPSLRMSHRSPLYRQSNLCWCFVGREQVVRSIFVRMLHSLVCILHPESCNRPVPRLIPTAYKLNETVYCRPSYHRVRSVIQSHQSPFECRLLEYTILQFSQ